MCELCEENKVVNKCLECKQGLCQQCSKIHQRATGTRHHNIFPISSPEAKSISFKTSTLCEQHNRPIELWCVQDQVLVCMLCIATNHHSHKCQTLQEAFNLAKDKIDTLLLSSKSTLDTSNSSVLKLESELKAMDTKKIELKNSIDIYFNQLKLLLNQRHSQITDSLNSLIENEKKDLHYNLIP